MDIQHGPSRGEEWSPLYYVNFWDLNNACPKDVFSLSVLLLSS